ncbi:MAG: carbon-nitrogen hydrolase family protein [Planctomycetota bacterium]|jgi:predicted amidohydrolase
MDKLVIGVWQGVCADGDLQANLDKTADVIGRAAEAGCDFLCLPEQFLSGYGCAEFARTASMALDDPRLLALAAHAADRNVVTLVGMIEKRGDLYANTQVVLDGGRVAGHYTKTMQVGGDKELMGFFDDDLPVFVAGGVCFGIIVCHDSSFPEVAATMAWKGARIIFSPHYNSIARARMDDHRVIVRNNHVGIAAHYNVVVARSNVVGHWDRERFGYGDSAIFAPNGAPLAEAGLFAERLITADVAPYLDAARWRNRKELRPPIIRQLYDAAIAALKGEGAGP